MLEFYLIKLSNSMPSSSAIELNYSYTS